MARFKIRIAISNATGLERLQARFAGRIEYRL